MIAIKPKKMIKQIVSDIKIYPIVFVVGAGVSIQAGIPLVRQLRNILWKIVGDDKVIIDAIKKETGSIEWDTKKIINDDNIFKVFDVIEKYPNLVREFQKEFSIINNREDKSPTDFHRGLAWLIHEGYVLAVVSLNWDSMIEDAWKMKYGTVLSYELIKPHGSVLLPDKEWVLPNQPGRISDEEERKLGKLIDGNIIQLVIAGYSERDATFVERCIKPIENISETYRVLPKCDSIALDANKFMNVLVSEIKFGSKSNRGWEQVIFDNQQGIEYAILGGGLNENNVEECPKLSFFQEAYNKLKRLNYLDIVGPSGTGKSLTAFQVARQFLIEGYEVLKCKDNIEIDIPSCFRKTLLIVDNAHNKLELVKSLRKIVNDKICLICIFTRDLSKDYVESLNRVEISSKEAKNSIYDYYLQNRNLIEPILKKINPQIGNDLSGNKRPFIYWLERAKNEKTPYMFNYILRNEPEKIKEVYEYLEELKYDKCVFIIAIYQVLNSDSNISLKALEGIISRTGYHEINTKNIKKNLCDERSILKFEPVNKFKFIHIYSAINFLIKFILTSRENQSYARKIFVIIFEDKKYNMLGFVWLINNLFTLHPPYNTEFSRLGLFSEEEIELLYQTVLDRIEDKYSMIALERLEQHISQTNIIDENLAKIIEKMNNLGIDEYYSASLYLNNCINKIHSSNSHMLEQISDNLNYVKIMNDFNISSLSDLYGFGSFFDRLVFKANEKYINCITNRVDTHYLVSKLHAMEVEDFFGVTLCVGVFKEINKKFSALVIDSCLNSLKKYNQTNILKTWSNIDDHYWLKNIFDYSMYDSDDISSLSDNRYVKEYIDSINTNRMCHEIEEVDANDIYAFEDLLRFIYVKNQIRFDEIVVGLSIDKINSNIHKFWNTEIADKFLIAIGHSKVGKQLCAAIIDQNIQFIEEFDSVPILYCSDNFIINQLKLESIKLFSRYTDEVSFRAICRIIQLNEQLGIKVMERYKTEICKNLSPDRNLKRIGFEDSDMYIKECVVQFKEIFIKTIGNIVVSYLAE